MENQELIVEVLETTNSLPSQELSTVDKLPKQEMETISWQNQAGETVSVELPKMDDGQVYRRHLGGFDINDTSADIEDWFVSDDCGCSKPATKEDLFDAQCIEAEFNETKEWNRRMWKLAEWHIQHPGKQPGLGYFLSVNKELAEMSKTAKTPEQKLLCWAFYKLHNRKYFRHARDYVRYMQANEAGVRAVIGMPRVDYEWLMSNGHDPIRDARIQAWQSWKPNYR